MPSKISGHCLKANSHYCDREKGAYFSISCPRVSYIQKFKNYVYNKITGPYISSIFRLLIAKLINFLVPFIGAIHKKYYPNNNLALCLTTICNVQCFNCVSSCEQAPANDCMSVKQIEKFVQEAIDLKYYWNRISLTGGEPTLHPQIFEIIEALKKYKTFNPDCVFDIVTNGAGNKVKSILSQLPNWIVITNSEKREGQQSQLFTTFNIAPIDCKGYRRFTDFSKGCQVIESCNGLALSMYGYYPTSQCVLGIDRVFGFNIGIKKLSSVNEKSLRDQMKILCQYCGIFKEPYEIIRKPRVSPSWEKAYGRFKKEKPELSLY